VGLVLLVLGIGGKGESPRNYVKNAVKGTQNLARRMTFTKLDVPQAVLEGASGPGIVIHEVAPLSSKSQAILTALDKELDKELDDLCNHIRRIARLNNPPELRWSDLRVTARPSYCGVCASFDNNEPAVIVQKTSGALTKGCTALMGPSGSGKTTLLHAVTGLPTTGLTTRGTVTLDGIAVDQLPRGTISLVPQDAVLPEELSAREALNFACALGLRIDKKERVKFVDVILSRLGLSHVLHLPIGGRLAGGSGLSGGERKRVSVGVSIATCPHAILLDEPSSGLDSYSAFELIRLLKTICTRTNRTVLVFCTSLHLNSLNCSMGWYCSQKAGNSTTAHHWTRCPISSLWVLHRLLTELHPLITCCTFLSPMLESSERTLEAPSRNCAKYRCRAIRQPERLGYQCSRRFPLWQEAPPMQLRNVRWCSVSITAGVVRVGAPPSSPCRSHLLDKRAG